MVSNSKILTVSYGTFSCTLEGFDDPFTTMKSIAEYFRDLAADDRYFGAEPPQPDTEMLHRIAEREIQRRVETRLEAGGIVMRPAEDAPAPAGGAVPAVTAREAQPEAKQRREIPSPLVEAEVESATAPIESDAAHSAREPEPHPIPEAARAAQREGQPESIAAKLRRIREVVERRHAARDGDDIEDHMADDFYAEAPIGEAFSPAMKPSAAGAEDDFEDEAPFEAEAAAVRAHRETGDQPSDTEPEVADEADEVAVTQAPEAEAGEDEGGDSDEDSIAAVLGAMLEPEDGDAAQADETSAAHETGAAGDEEFEAAPDDQAEPEELLVVEDEDLEEALDDEDSVISGAWDDTPEQAPEPLTAGGEDEVEPEEAVDATAEAEQDAEEAPARPVAAARIIRVRRTEPAEDAIRDEDWGKTKAPKPAAVPSSLSPEDEAELMAELEEVERDAEQEARETGKDVRAAERMAARAVLDRTSPDQDAVAVDRLMAEANTKLESSEATRRRSAIAHLRAAVQAKRADSEIKGADTVETAVGFRDDLARVVRPRRLPSGDSSPRRLAPLVLVSEQRIDTPKEPEPKAAVARPVRPRRITKGNLALDTIDDDMAAIDEAAAPEPSAAKIPGFATFAQETGAEGMAELLEAAAAYECFVAGRPHFSRPQIMELVLEYDPDGSFTREEGLRAFGKLLRDGTIRKITRGQFEISEDSRFRPEE
jgi:hypothetical protein